MIGDISIIYLVIFQILLRKFPMRFKNFFTMVNFESVSKLWLLEQICCSTSINLLNIYAYIYIYIEREREREREKWRERERERERERDHLERRLISNWLSFKHVVEENLNCIIDVNWSYLNATLIYTYIHTYKSTKITNSLLPNTHIFRNYVYP